MNGFGAAEGKSLSTSEINCSISFTHTHTPSMHHINHKAFIIEFISIHANKKTTNVCVCVKNREMLKTYRKILPHRFLFSHMRILFFILFRRVKCFLLISYQLQIFLLTFVANFMTFVFCL